MLTILVLMNLFDGDKHPHPMASEKIDCWVGDGVYQIPINAMGDEIRYGHALIQNTAYYLGPKGTVQQITNGMNCQNCHLDAGTKPWGINYGAVAANYPQWRHRSGTIENIEKRINDCMERSLNGSNLTTDSREMLAMKAYILWLGASVPKGSRPKGSGIQVPVLLDRAADPVKGQFVYTRSCASCHGASGEGQKNKEGYGYLYPPLWGMASYNTGAGLYRISNLAGYVKNNMPYPTTYRSPQLTDEQAWDVAAYINSRPRPAGKIEADWPVIATKPFDHPFGPYADSNSSERHKYGPWTDMKK